jgi:sulfotransferase
MIEKQFFFLTGLPRSGSTVLAALLNQHPDVYVTPTSPMLDQLISNQNIWHNLQTVKANPVPVQLDNVTRNLINAMWKHRPEPIIIDKNRGWNKNMPASEILFGEKIKTVVTVRDLPSIMSSWLKLLRNNPGNYLDRSLTEQHKQVNDENRMLELWNNMVRDCMEGLVQVKKDAGDRIMLVSYDDFISHGEQTLSLITNFLGLDSYKYNINDISNQSKDDDLSAWGLNGMHTIRTQLQRADNDPKQILGQSLFNRFVELEKQYLGE